MRTSFFLDFGLLWLRFIVSAILFFGHGLEKFISLFSGNAISFPNPLGIGGELSFVLMMLAETLCPLLIAVGFLTRLACIPLVFGFFVATFLFHGFHTLADMELALLFFTAYLGLFFTGSGHYSIARWMQHKCAIENPLARFFL